MRVDWELQQTETAQHGLQLSATVQLAYSLDLLKVGPVPKS